MVDPVTSALGEFQKKIRKFRANQNKSCLMVLTESQHIPLLLKVLRGEEWMADNGSPFIITDRAFLKDKQDVSEAVCFYIKEHYDMVRKGYKEASVDLQPLEYFLQEHDEPLENIAAHCFAFHQGLKDKLEAPYFCWFPRVISSYQEWLDGCEYFIDSLSGYGFRYIFSIDKDKFVKKFEKKYEDILTTIDFTINETETNSYFDKLFGPPAAGHMKGTPSGAAAPDVTPPERVNKMPSDEQIRNAMRELNIPPVLTESEAEQLKMYVFNAAKAAAKNDKATTIGSQIEACNICEQADVKLEHCLMRLTLASYYLQFKDKDEAIQEYRKAESLAAEINAYVQLAQIRLALGFLYNQKKKTLEEAIDSYEQAAVAAAIGESWILYLDALRMAGTCYLKQKDTDAAMLCWLAAVKKSKMMSTEEIRLSTFMDIAGSFIKLLEKEGLYEQAESVGQLVYEIGKENSVSMENT